MRALNNGSSENGPAAALGSEYVTSVFTSYIKILLVAVKSILSERLLFSELIMAIQIFTPFSGTTTNKHILVL